MNRYDNISTKELIRLWIEEENSNQLSYFRSLNIKGGHYNKEQREYAIEKATTIGVRATSRTLHVPRRTIQRWLRAEEITVKRCPNWVYDWAYWRKKRQQKGQRIMSYEK